MGIQRQINIRQNTAGMRRVMLGTQLQSITWEHVHDEFTRDENVLIQICGRYSVEVVALKETLHFEPITRHH